VRLESLPVLRGTLDLLVLRALLARPMHGYEISSWLDRHTNGSLAIFDSALYQALYRLEKARLIGAEWGVSDNNRRARYYHVAARGRAHLRAETTSWLRYAEAVTAVLTAPLALE
jgi:transcriptional regulator